MKKYIDWPLTILMALFMLITAPLVIFLVAARNVERRIRKDERTYL